MPEEKRFHIRNTVFGAVLFQPCATGEILRD
jgi:hypothetical protein